MFICGLMGSGTTLISRLIDQEFVTRGVANESALRMPRNSPLRVARTHRYRSLEEYLSALKVPGEVDVERVRSDLVRFYRRKERPASAAASLTIVDKAPNAHMVRVRVLSQAFQTSSFILVFRHPIGAVEGLRRKWRLCRDETVERVSEFWVEMHMETMRQATSSGVDIVSVCYEDLCQSPESVLTGVGQRLGLRRRDAPLRVADRPNLRGFGVRNVSDGLINVSPEASNGGNGPGRRRTIDAATVERIAGSTYETLRHWRP